MCLRPLDPGQSDEAEEGQRERPPADHVEALGQFLEEYRGEQGARSEADEGGLVALQPPLREESAREASESVGDERQRDEQPGMGNSARASTDLDALSAQSPVSVFRVGPAPGTSRCHGRGGLRVLDLPAALVEGQRDEFAHFVREKLHRVVEGDESLEPASIVDDGLTAAR